MSLWDRIDEESKPALEILWGALPGGLNGIPDIVQRRAAYEAFRAAAPRGEYPNLDVSDHTYTGKRHRAGSRAHLHPRRRHDHG
jgi:hypothetical protein